MPSRLSAPALLFQACALATSVVARPAAAGPQAAGQGPETNPDAHVAIASLLTQPSMNVFRRFTVERAKVLEFYGDVLGLTPLPPIGMPGGSQMSRFRVGTSEIKLTGATPGRQDRSGAVRDTTGLRVFTFFFPDEAALAARFAAHGYPAPEFRAREGGTRGAMVLDPDHQWVELVATPGAPPDAYSRLEVGLTVSDLEKSRAFYREFVGLEELVPVESALLGVTKYPYRHGTMTVNLWTFGRSLPANTYTAGIQYVISDVSLVDARARAAGVTVTTPLGNFSAGLRTIWLADPDGITNYFAQLMRSPWATGTQ
jgi:catechol 2,3-dioxygenase-like lactoylglutathione lyase family enzyme